MSHYPEPGSRVIDKFKALLDLSYYAINKESKMSHGLISLI